MPMSKVSTAGAALLSKGWEDYFGRRPNHSKPLKNLSPKHKKMLSLHLRGISNRDIATIMGMHEVRVSIILNDDLCKAWKARAVGFFDDEFNALYAPAIEAVRSGLTSENESIRLKAADKFFKGTGKYQRHEKREDSAEDLVARVLKRVGELGSESVRELPARKQALQIIDITPKEVPVGNAK